MKNGKIIFINTQESNGENVIINQIKPNIKLDIKLLIKE